MRNFTDNEIIRRVETHAKGFDGWRPGVYDVWVRKQKTAKDVDIFTDKVFTYAVGADGRPEFRMACTGTSVTGSWALKNFKTYNPNGAAILAADHFVRNSHAWGFHKGYRAYQQVKAFPFYRDKDFDLVAEENGTLYTQGLIGANCHRAKLNAVSQVIYNWSAGCLVRNAAYRFAGWLAYMGKRPLSVTILKEF